MGLWGVVMCVKTTQGTLRETRHWGVRVAAATHTMRTRQHPTNALRVAWQSIGRGREDSSSGHEKQCHVARRLSKNIDLQKGCTYTHTEREREQYVHRVDKQSNQALSV